jgi:hypothetical protein
VGRDNRRPARQAVIWLSLALAGAAAALTARLFAEQLGTGWLEAPCSTPIQHIHRP